VLRVKASVVVLFKRLRTFNTATTTKITQLNYIYCHCNVIVTMSCSAAKFWIILQSSVVICTHKNRDSMYYLLGVAQGVDGTDCAFLPRPLADTLSTCPIQMHHMIHTSQNR